MDYTLGRDYTLGEYHRDRKNSDRRHAVLDGLADSTRVRSTNVNAIELHQSRIITSVPEISRLLPNIDATFGDMGGEHDPIVQVIRNAHRKSIHSLFNALPPPSLHLLVGEYDSELLSQGYPLYNFITKAVFQVYGKWLGKAFYPVSCSNGAGYNIFGSHQSPVRTLPMETKISRSAMDHRLSLTIAYNDNTERLITRLVGEIRQVTPNVMLGIGIAAPSKRYRKIARRKVPFLLYGPRRRPESLPRSACRNPTGTEMEATSRLIEQCRMLYGRLLELSCQPKLTETNLPDHHYQPMTALSAQIQACFEQVSDSSHQNNFLAVYDRCDHRLVVHQAMHAALQMIHHIHFRRLASRHNDTLWNHVSKLVGPPCEVVDRFLGAEQEHDFQHALAQAAEAANQLARDTSPSRTAVSL